MSPIVTFQIYKLTNFALIPNILPLSPFSSGPTSSLLSQHNCPCALCKHVWYTNGEHDFKWNVYLLSLPLDDPNSIFIGEINFLSGKSLSSVSELQKWSGATWCAPHLS